MGTKNNPGKFDCYAAAEPDEPMFTLLGRDPVAAEVVRYWVHLRHGGQPVNYCGGIPRKELNGVLTEKGQEALDCADSMVTWRKINHG